MSSFLTGLGVSFVLTAMVLPPLQEQDCSTMTNTPSPPISGSSSRPPPPDVAAVTVSGVRYEPALDGLPADAEDTSGWLRATHVASGEVLWLMQVYSAPPVEAGDPFSVGPVATVFMASLKVSNGLLLVTDELGRRFHVDPSTGSSVALP